MASSTLLQSATASYCGQFPVLSPPLSVRLPYGNPKNGNGLVSVRATGGIVLVEKTEAEKANRLKTTDLEKIVPLPMEEFSYTNIHQVPKIEKVVVNCGIGDAAQNAKGLEAAMNDLVITGQRPIKKKSEELNRHFQDQGRRSSGNCCYTKRKWSLTLNAYEDGCEFADPAGSFKGLQRFKRNCTNFGLLIDKSSMKLMKWEDLEDKGIGHWRFSCVMSFPWKPILSANGYTEYYFDAKSGNVCRHVEH